MMMRTIQITEPDYLQPTSDTVVIDYNYERKLAAGFLTPEQAKEYKQLVKVLANKQCQL